MELNLHNNLVDPLGGNPLNRAQQLSGPAGGLKREAPAGLTPDFGRTLAEAQQTGDRPSSGHDDSEKSERLMEVSRQFEGLLIHQMLKAMRQTVNKTGLLDGFASGQFETMLDEELSKEVVKHRSIGLAQNIYNQMSQLLPDSGSSSKTLVGGVS